MGLGQQINTMQENIRATPVIPAALILISVVPAKAGNRDFSGLSLGPRLRGDDELACPRDFLIASFAGVTSWVGPGQAGG